MEPFSWLIGGGLFVAGLLTGRVGRRPRQSKLAAPICTCKHGSGSHENGKSCKMQTQRPVLWLLNGCVAHYEWVQCPCLRYDGPEPLPRSLESYILPELPTPKED